MFASTTPIHRTESHRAAPCILALLLGLLLTQAAAAQSNRYIAVARYLDNGSLDSTFNSTGYVVTDILDSYWEEGRGVGVTEGGDILVGAQATVSGPGGLFGLVTYDTSGQRLFINLSGDLPGASEVARGMVLDSQERPVTAGGALWSLSGSSVGVQRRTAGGGPDTSFDGDGFATVSFPNANDPEAYAVAVDASDRPVTAGYLTSGSFQHFIMTRHTTSGGLDTSYGSGGRAVVSFPFTFSSTAFGVAVDPWGWTIASGQAFDGEPHFAVACLDPWGNPEPSFGSGGTVLTDFASTNAEVSYAVTTDSQGRIIAAGYAHSQQLGDVIALARYDIFGNLDPSFDGDGKVLTDFTSSSHEQAFAVGVDAQGRIVVAGVAAINGGNGRQFALARYLDDGSLDASFDGDGKVITDIPVGNNDEIFALTFDAYGRIVVAGGVGGTFNM